MTFQIGTDIGGTFTDCVIVDDAGVVTTGKAPTTPHDRADGFFDALTVAAAERGLGLADLLRDTSRIVHATTTATNAIVERKGAVVGVLTTAGHGEVLSIMRGGGRTKGLSVDDLLYLPGSRKPDPLVPPRRVREVTERVDCFGEVVVELVEDDVRAAVRALVDDGVEALAISFLWSFLDPAHERRARDIARELAPDLFVACSHEIAPRQGEYYRTVATVINCYIGPLMARYVAAIDDRARALGLPVPVQFAQCIGGSATIADVSRRPLYTIDSGPVSGIVASGFLGERFSHGHIITADMGGTTFDVSVLPGGVPQRREQTVMDQYAMHLSMVDVQSIGAGGGSIAWVDERSGSIKVGPRSAAADPGPVCYGRGGSEPTVTDADLVLGFIGTDSFLGGRQHLDADAARAAVASLASRVGLGVEEAAAGIVDIVDTIMSEKIRRMTVDRGHDPRDFVIYAFGGAGPMHAVGFSRHLGVRTVVVPVGNIASVLSALGTVSGDIVTAVDRSVRLIAPFDGADIERTFAELEQEARSRLVADGFGDASMRSERSVSMKYAAQAFDVELPADELADGDEYVDRFVSAYAARYGPSAGYAPAGIALTSLRVKMSALLDKPALAASSSRAATEQRGTRKVWWPEHREFVDTPILSRVGTVTPVAGPAIVELPDTTVPIRPGTSVRADAFGNLVITLEEGL